VTQEKCQWVLLTEKLNDVAVLSIFVSHFGSAQTDNRYDVPNISLKKILNEGKGIISELVASWLIGVNIPIDIIYKKSSDDGIDSSEEKDVIKKLEILKIHFPYSLNPPVILSQVIWKLISHWSKNLSDIQYLKNSIKYLDLFQVSCREL
jgi:Rab3 GTPase-activating protein non-catalytic subunit